MDDIGAAAQAPQKCVISMETCSTDPELPRHIWTPLVAPCRKKRQRDNPAAYVGQLKDKKLKTKLKHTERVYQYANKAAAKVCTGYHVLHPASKHSQHSRQAATQQRTGTHGHTWQPDTANAGPLGIKPTM